MAGRGDGGRGHELSGVVHHMHTMMVWQYVKIFKRFVDTNIISCKFILQI